MNKYSVLVWDKIPEGFDDGEDEIQEFESDRQIKQYSLPEAVKKFESLTDVYCKILLRYHDPYDHDCIPDVLMEWYYDWGEELIK